MERSRPIALPAICCGNSPARKALAAALLSLALAGCHAPLGWSGRSHETAPSPKDEPASRAEDAPSESAPSRYHIVKPGETLPHLATLYGVSVTDLIHDNGLDLEDGLKPEQLIHIPK